MNNAPEPDILRDAVRRGAEPILRQIEMAKRKAGRQDFAQPDQRGGYFRWATKGRPVDGMGVL